MKTLLALLLATNAAASSQRALPKAFVPEAPLSPVPLKAMAAAPQLPSLAPLPALQAPVQAAAAPVQSVKQAPSAQAKAALPEPGVFDGAKRFLNAAMLAAAVCVGACSSDPGIPDVPEGNGTYVPDDVYPITYAQIYQDIDDHFYDYDRTPGEYHGRVTNSDNDRVYKVRLPKDGFLNVQVDELFGAKYDLLVVDDDGDIRLRDNNWFDISRAHEVIGDLPAGTYYVILHNNNDGALGETYWLELYY